MKRLGLATPLLLALAACQSIQSGGLGGLPPLTPVGSGAFVSAIPTPAALPVADVRAPSSLWSQSNRGLFSDPRAHRIGDILTVSIDINDQAQFANASDRSATGTANGSFGLGLNFGGFGTAAAAGSADGKLNSTGTASTAGQGSIDRSEKLHLLVAALVSEVMPDGNLLISGSQEVRVNNEVRVLTVAGIVRPLDISAGNLIAYDKIAEARVSYGGRGKLTAVQ